MPLLDKGTHSTHSSEPYIFHVVYPKDASQQVSGHLHPFKVAEHSEVQTYHGSFITCCGYGHFSKSLKGSFENLDLIIIHPFKTRQGVPTASQTQIMKINTASDWPAWSGSSSVLLPPAPHHISPTPQHTTS